MNSFPENPRPVLLVEDLALHRKVLEASLRKMGYTVVETQTPEEALARLGRERFFAVFLDWQFENGTGEPVATQLRDHHPETLVIITSAGEAPEMTDLYRRSGAHHVLGKHFTADHLRHVLAAPTPRPSDALTEPNVPPPHPTVSLRQHEALAQELRELHAAVADGRRADAGRAAHNLEGIARLLNLAEIARLAREAELALLSAQAPGDWLNALRDELEKLPSARIEPSRHT